MFSKQTSSFSRQPRSFSEQARSFSERTLGFSEQTLSFTDAKRDQETGIRLKHIVFGQTPTSVSKATPAPCDAVLLLLFFVVLDLIGADIDNVRVSRRPHASLGLI